MNLSYSEIMNLINKERVKHQEILKEGGSQINKEYSRYAIFVMRDFEKEIRGYLAKKYK